MSKLRWSGSRGMFAALVVSLSSIAALWLWAVPSVLSRSTFASMASLMIGGATVALLTWRNAHATSTIGQLLQATEAAGGQAPSRRAGTTHTRLT
jgi:hypothetical protein